MNYTTDHDTSNRTMTHDFGNGNQLIVDFKFQRIISIYKNETKDVFYFDENYTVTDHKKYIENFIKSIQG